MVAWKQYSAHKWIPKGNFGLSVDVRVILKRILLYSEYIYSLGIERHTMKSFEEYRICIMYYYIYYLVGLAVISMPDGPSPPSSSTVSQLNPRPDTSSSIVDFWQQSLERGMWSKATKSHW